MEEKKDRGAIVVEATLSLTAFVFAIYTLLMLVNIYYIQSRIGVALHTAARELSEYSYLYFKLGGDGIMDKLHEGTEDANGTAKNTIQGISTMFQALSGLKDGALGGDLNGAVDKLGAAYESGRATARNLVDQISEDPRQFILGMAYLALDQAAEQGMTLLCKAICKGLMKKNLVAHGQDDADSFLRRYHVVEGLNGLDFQYTTYLPPDRPNYIQVVVSYKVRVVKLLDLDVTFSFRQCSKTLAWARGISKLHTETDLTKEGGSIWDNPLVMVRGRYIVSQEKQNYRYTCSGQGFDAYNNAGGANEFISIISVNTSMSSYQTVKGIKAQLGNSFYKMRDQISKLGPEIQVEDRAGERKTLLSDPETRSYTILLVVPENAPDDILAQAIAQAEAAYPGLKVVLKKAYGSPSVEKETDDGG